MKKFYVRHWWGGKVRFVSQRVKGTRPLTFEPRAFSFDEACEVAYAMRGNGCPCVYIVRA